MYILIFAFLVPKYPKNDQHDSGIEVSETHDSAGSSTRSSPSTEQKIKAEPIKTVKNTSGVDMPKPQRTNKVCTITELNKFQSIL